MNATRVQELIINYKKLAPNCERTVKNVLFNEILHEYKPILHKLCDGYKDKEEAHSIAVAQILYAIEEYNLDKSVMFNTYLFYWLKAISRIYNKNIMNFSEIELGEETENILNLHLDLDKILNEKELIIYNTAIKGLNTKGNPKLKAAIDVIIQKIKAYIGDASND